MPDGTKVIVVPMKSAISGFMRRLILLLAVYAVFVAGALTLHWYAGTQNSATAQSLRTWNLAHDPENVKQYHRGYTDWVMSGEILGLAACGVLGRPVLWGTG